MASRIVRDQILGERTERRAFENSTSWRMTAPLRWLTDELRDQAVLENVRRIRAVASLRAMLRPFALYRSLRGREASSLRETQ